MVCKRLQRQTYDQQLNIVGASSLVNGLRRHWCRAAVTHAMKSATTLLLPGTDEISRRSERDSIDRWRFSGSGHEFVLPRKKEAEGAMLSQSA